jgi:hypothetical protein
MTQPHLGIVSQTEVMALDMVLRFEMTMTPMIVMAVHPPALSKQAGSEIVPLLQMQMYALSVQPATFKMTQPHLGVESQTVGMASDMAQKYVTMETLTIVMAVIVSVQLNQAGYEIELLLMTLTYALNVQLAIRMIALAYQKTVLLSEEMALGLDQKYEMMEIQVVAMDVQQIVSV